MRAGIPFLSDLTLGNDYVGFPIQHQIELMFSVKMGSFPLYVPGFAGGQSASALTLGQIFHPISHLSSILPGYWEGKALEWNTLFRLLSLGVAHLSLFLLIRRFGINIFVAAILQDIELDTGLTRFAGLVVFGMRSPAVNRRGGDGGVGMDDWTEQLYLTVVAIDP